MINRVDCRQVVLNSFEETLTEGVYTHQYKFVRIDTTEILPLIFDEVKRFEKTMDRTTKTIIKIEFSR